VAGSVIAGTREMLNFCRRHNIVSDSEIIPLQKAIEAIEHGLQSDVRNRNAIDMASHKTSS
jgi:D-arabinose 1-dehydrogenase-like Zn-dependent alcohol dehydrogenase